MMSRMSHLTPIIFCSVWKQERIESFRFKDDNDYEYEIQLKVFSRVVEKYSTREASLYKFSPEKLVQLFLLDKV